MTQFRHGKPITKEQRRALELAKPRCMNAACNQAAMRDDHLCGMHRRIADEESDQEASFDEIRDAIDQVDDDNMKNALTKILELVEAM